MPGTHEKKRGCSVELEYYWDRRSHLEEELEYYWERRPGCEEPYLVSRHGSGRRFWIYNGMTTDTAMWTNSISSKSSVATLPDTKRLKLTPDYSEAKKTWMKKQKPCTFGFLPGRRPYRMASPTSRTPQRSPATCYVKVNPPRLVLCVTCVASTSPYTTPPCPQIMQPPWL